MRSIHGVKKQDAENLTLLSLTKIQKNCCCIAKGKPDI